MKRGERPGESRERNTAIHHWIFLDICGVIKGDELMPDHLRINRKRHCRQTQQDEKIGSPECWNVADPHGAASVRCNSARGFSFSRCSFGHSSRDYQRSDKGISAVAKLFKGFSCCPEFLGNRIRLQPVSHPLQ